MNFHWISRIGHQRKSGEQKLVPRDLSAASLKTKNTLGTNFVYCTGKPTFMS